MTPSVLQSGLRFGDVVHRHRLTVSCITDPVIIAAAVRGTERVMLTCHGHEPGAPVLLALGELAVCSRYAVGDPQLLTGAVDFLTSLEFVGATSPAERSWFGFIGYQAAVDFERLTLQDEGLLPTYDLFLPQVLIQVSPKGTVVLGRGETAAAARRAAERVASLLRRPAAPRFEPTRSGAGRFTSDVDAYYESVRRAKNHILAGDIFQVVLSIRYLAPTQADGLLIYQRLSDINRSPYQFWYRSGEFEAVGMSPEPCVLLKHSRVLIRPLAGTRPRGVDPISDQLTEQDLFSSEKELAEHRMLVDLARNDLGRVCKPGSVQVPRLMEVERYSHVMHLTSDVVGALRDGIRTDDLIRATFPAGTMTGAPKIRAMEIIDELEPVGRGLYSGAVGSFSATHVDLYLTIRSIVLSHGQMQLQAGGGIVYDSDPTAEHKECLAKLGAASHAAGVTVDLEKVCP